MSNTEKLNFKIKKGKDKRLGFKVSEINGVNCRLKIIEVENNSNAHELRLKVGDVIVKINAKDFKVNKKDWITEINESKCSSITLLIERERSSIPTKASANNLSQSLSNSNLSDANNSNNESSISKSITTESFTKLSNSICADQIIEPTHYNQLKFSQVLTDDSSFIPESSLDDYLEPADVKSPPITHHIESPFNMKKNSPLNQKDDFASLNNKTDQCYNDTISSTNENSRDLEEEKPMVKRKPAYKYSMHDQSYFSSNSSSRIIRGSMDQINTPYYQQQYQPKLKVKQATKLYSPQAANDVRLNITLKRRTNTSGALPALDSFTKPNFTKNSGSNNTKGDGMTKATSMSPTGFKEFTKTDDTTMQNSNSASSCKAGHMISSSEANLTRTVPSQPICVKIKIFSFYNVVKKGMWKFYTLEKENIGVMFTCNEINHKEMPYSSLVLDHRFTAPQTYFSSWPQSNCASKFLLPISNPPYDKDVIISRTNHNIRVCYVTHQVEFVINVDGLDDSVLMKLFDMLQIEFIIVLPAPTVTQSLLPTSGNDQTSKRKVAITEPIKKFKPSKSSTDPPKPPQLSKLVRSDKVKNVPLVFVICAEIVEKLGLTVDGIYRKSGNISDRKNLEEIIYKEPPVAWASRKEWLKIHNVTNLLKRILDKYKLLDAGTALKMAIIKPPNDCFSQLELEDRIQSCMDMQYHLQSMTPTLSTSSEERECRLATFLYLLRHLNRVSKHASQHMMNCKNLAICLMPNLIEELPESYQNNGSSRSSADDKQTNGPRGLPGNNNKVMLNDKMTTIMSFWIQYADFITDIMSGEQKSQEKQVFEKVKQFVNTLLLSNFNTVNSSTDLLSKSTDDSSVTVLSSSSKNSGDTSGGVLNDEERNSLDDTKKEENEVVDYAQVVGDIFSEYIGEGSELTNLPVKSSSVSSENYPDNSSGVVLNSFTKTGSINFGKYSPLTGQHGDTKKYTNITTDSIASMGVNLTRRSSSTSPKNNRKYKNPIDLKYINGRSSVSNNTNEIPETYRVLSKSVKNLPLVIEICVKLVENFGMNIEGIYRRNGAGSEISTLKTMVYTEDPTAWPAKFELWRRLLNTSCLMKSVIKDMGLILKEAWLGISSQFSVSTPKPSVCSTDQECTLSNTELRNTLMAAAYWLSITRLIQVTSSHMTKQTNSPNNDDSFLSASKSGANKVCDKVLKNIAQIKWTTLKYLLKHLKNVLENNKTNKMNMHALCVCFMPVLLEDDNDTNNLMISAKKNPIIIQVLIEHQDWILQWGDRPEKEQCDGTMSESLDKYLLNRELDYMLQKSLKKKDAASVVMESENEQDTDSSNDINFNAICSSDKVLTLLTETLASSDRNDSRQNIHRRHSEASSNDNYMVSLKADKGIIKDYL